MASSASPVSSSRPQRWRPAVSANGVSTTVTSPSPSSSSSGGVASDLLQLLTLDLSPLEKRFEEVFARLEAVERVTGSTSPRPDEPQTQDGSVEPRTEAVETEAGLVSPPPVVLTSSPSAAVVFDGGEMAKELESLHATQLRLKIEHELAQSSYKVEMEALRRDLLALPQHADLHNFRAEMDVLLTSTIKSLGDQQMLLWQDVERTLATRELTENQWKSQFESSMNARIQDVWAGLHASQHKVSESVSAIEADMFKVEATTKETLDTVEILHRHSSELGERLAQQEEESATQEHAIAQLNALVKQTNLTMATQDGELQSAIDGLTLLLNETEQRHANEQDAYTTFVAEVEKTLSYCTTAIDTTIQPALQAHQDKLLALDAGLSTHSVELKSCQDRFIKTDSRLGSLDGRLVQQEKQTATLVQVVQEHHHEMTRQLGDTKKGLELAMQDRVGIKRAATEMSFTVQEVQQTLQEVSKMAATTELSLTRTAAEIPKLHVLASTSVANIATTRQGLADLSLALVDEKKFTQQLQQHLDKEVQSSVTRFADLHRRDEASQQSIATTNSTMQHIKHALEDAIKYNSNMIHQLNAVVDSLAITESATDMDDKLQRFALQTAELGLKLELFVAGASSSSSGVTADGSMAVAKDQVRAELAILLTKIVRFLGAGVSIDYNKYFLTASKLALPSLDPSSSAMVVELPAMHVLEQLRATKVSVFVGKMHGFLDQLRPVPHSVRHVHDFRDHFENKVRYVLAFGLANLFPNVGRPRHPNRRTPHAGTCIACDRPLDDDHDISGDHDQCRSFGRLLEATDPEVDAVDDQRMRRSKLVSSAGTTTAASSGVAHKVDTRTTVKGRSGTPSQQRPRSAAFGTTSLVASSSAAASPSGMHHAPGTSEYVYRAGFRLPRPSTAGMMGKSASAAELAALTSLMVASAAGCAPPEDAAKPTIDDSVASCLEKVALVGKHGVSSNQNQTQTLAAVEIPKPVMMPQSQAPSPASSTPSHTVRPHTAPLRSRSLPRLEAVAEPTR